MSRNFYRCKKCKSLDIQQNAGVWVDVNSGVCGEPDYEFGDDGIWCVNCDDYTELEECVLIPKGE
ncbi:hypothetical protein [Carboxylicivirga sp. M1479]|uniref:hypothetical protein n=1 Tax=Carboxylicivirga sp. M1479 TaxID=2594476 RepID=UPI0011776AD5|nr:hypothetical protein [Carboxylicivirga sp. M1479]TRX71531.1 hypothetical protein FNN09_06050 [Carboxylicivirga sp. M1479]